MNEKIPMGVDPKIKKEINEERFEGEAAVLIGKKEEMPELLEKLESEGKTGDLETYIKLHKEIILPSNEITDKELKGEVLNNKGKFLFSRSYNEGEYFSYFLKYIDRDGNIADVNILAENIAELKGEMDRERSEHKGFENIQFQNMQTIVEKRVKGLGFMTSESEDYDCWNQILKNIKKYKERLKKEGEERKEKEFNL